MGLVRGNPLVLVALFFGAAVLLMGGLYALFPMAIKDPNPVLIAIMGALGLSLAFSLLVIGRIFWVIARVTYGTEAGRSSVRK
jgi:xanthosine utilization system XapX-like protein